MPAYAPAPAFADRRRHPRALLLIVGGHAALIAAVMTVKMDLPTKIFDPPIVVEPIPIPDDPPPIPEPPEAKPQPRDSFVDRPVRVIPIADPEPIDIDSSLVKSIPGPDPIIGNGIEPAPQPRPLAAPVRIGPRFATPSSKLKPPYPPDKLMREEEAALRLRIAIDERGRVVSVEPVGRADRSFLEAARKHLIAHWRYKPATEDGRPVESSTVITLRFELNG